MVLTLVAIPKRIIVNNSFAFSMFKRSINTVAVNYISKLHSLEINNLEKKSLKNLTGFLFNVYFPSKKTKKNCVFDYFR